MRRLGLAISLGLAATQCGGLARVTGNDLCLEGQRIECSCGGRRMGVRTCTAEGIGYGECVCSGGAGGGGISDDDSGPPADSCTSKSAWKGGLMGSDEMTPGRACMECHAKTPSTPQYTVAGTIYAGLHDADDCNGVDGLGVAVAFFTDNGSEIGPRLQLNRVGNFFSMRPMPTTYRVKVIAEGRESIMQSLVENGDCNHCHTASGALGANGRLLKSRP
jgi:hypothetical protein